MSEEEQDWKETERIDCLSGAKGDKEVLIKAVVGKRIRGVCNGLGGGAYMTLSKNKEGQTIALYEWCNGEFGLLLED